MAKTPLDSPDALPIAAYRDEIVEAVANNSIVFITTETGAGKTTQVPQYLLDAGHNLVITQPRRLAVRSVAKRVAEEYGTELGDIVGYRIGGGKHTDQKVSDATRALFTTDGLATAQWALNSNQQTVLIVDEVHEWNINIEVIVAWIRHLLDQSAVLGVAPRLKLVIMSATLQARQLRQFLSIKDGNGRTLEAPIIEVPGRTYPVEVVPPKISLENDAAYWLRQGRNVLVFQPGKSEIDACIKTIKRLAPEAIVMPLHGELTNEEQSTCLKRHDAPVCIVSTDIAESSLTIPYIDVVIDSGTAREVQVRNGVEGLYLVPISKARRTQRMGRAGRTKFGVYTDWCPVEMSQRPEFPTAEIERVRLEQTALRLAEAGFDMEQLNFFHQPKQKDIVRAKRMLTLLGCMDEGGNITKIGRRISHMPLSVEYARMIIEAERLGVVEEVLAIAAILEQDGILFRVCHKCKGYGEKLCFCWCEYFDVSLEDQSDCIAQLVVFNACRTLTKKEMQDRGVSPKAFTHVHNKWSQMADRLGVDTTSQPRLDEVRRENILRAVCAGMLHRLYRVYGKSLISATEERQLTNSSVVYAPDGSWIAGVPFDLEVERVRPSGVFGEPEIVKVTIPLLTLASRVELDWVKESSPHLFRQKYDDYAWYDEARGEVVTTMYTYFMDQELASEQVSAPSHPMAAQLIAQHKQRVWEQEVTNLVQPTQLRLMELFDLCDLDASLCHELVKAHQLPSVKDAATMLAWADEANRLIAKAESLVAVFDNVRRMRTEVDEFMLENHDVLGAHHETLRRFVNGKLPQDRQALEFWCADARRALDEAKRALESRDTTLLAQRLAARFNSSYSRPRS